MKNIEIFYANATNKNLGTSSYFMSWKDGFERVHGSVKNLNKVNEASVSKYYGLGSQPVNLELLIFCLDIYYSARLSIRKFLLTEQIEKLNDPRLSKKNIVSLLNEYSDSSPLNYSWLDEPAIHSLAEFAIELCRDADWKNPNTGDICQHEYHELYHRSIRHAIGAFFTPEWLAYNMICHQLEGRSVDEIKILEPCVGSGAFLLALWKYLKEQQYSDATIEFIFSNNVTAWELNPISVLACELNLLRISEALSCSEPIDPSRIVKEKNCVQLDLLPSKNDLFSSTQLKNGAQTDEVDRCDLVIGNPPWINWENLSKDTRSWLAPAWPELGIFERDGNQRHFSKENLSVFILYFCMEFYLKPDSGSLCFVMPQSIFKSSQNSRGFRKFMLQPSNTPIKISEVWDCTGIKVFSNASAPALVVHFNKGQVTEFPVNYLVAESKVKTNKLSPYQSPHELCWRKEIAQPVSDEDPQSNWMHFSSSVRTFREFTIGKPAYRARTGMFTGGANAVYYVRILEDLGDTWLIENITERAKIKVQKSQFEVEKSSLYPFARGRDLKLWQLEFDDTRAAIIPHSRETKMLPIPECDFSESCGRAYDYLKSHKGLLLSRGGLTKLDQRSLETGFYTLLRIGDYTFSDYKVCWKYISKEFVCAVVEPLALLGDTKKPIVVQEKLVSIACDTSQEAYYVCGYLSSDIVKRAIESRMVSTQISAGIIKDIYIPRFDETSDDHFKISALCKKGHERLAGQEGQINDLQKEISLVVEKLLRSRNLS